MTRQEFIEKYRHEFGGMVLDGATNQANGAALSLWLRNVLRKVDAILAAQYADLAPPEPVPTPTNGHANGNGKPAARRPLTGEANF